jgi:hypothetical protein
VEPELECVVKDVVKGVAKPKSDTRDLIELSGACSGAQAEKEHQPTAGCCRIQGRCWCSALDRQRPRPPYSRPKKATKIGMDMNPINRCPKAP